MNDESLRAIVVGDWVVDEHWVTGVHRSPTASRTGPQHKRSLHSPINSVASLSGAGRTASVLAAAKLPDDAKIEVWGLGIWAPGDTSTLKSMLEGHTIPTPFSIARFTPKETDSQNHEEHPRVELLNLADFIPKWDADVKANRLGTTHIIRVYASSGPNVRFIQRIDWEVPVLRQGGAWIHSEEELHDLNQEMPDRVNAVIIKDLRKGVVSEPLIAWLCKKYPAANWYVSSKAWRPAWMPLLSQINLRLITIPQVAANLALRDDVDDRWLTPRGLPTDSALKVIGELQRDLKGAHVPSLVVLPSDLHLIARAGGEQPGDKFCTAPALEPPLKNAIGLPMASLFFGAFSAIDLSLPDESFAMHVTKALEYTLLWRQKEAERSASPDGQHEQEEHLHVTRDRSPSFTLQNKDWKKEETGWTQALNERGIVKTEKGLVLQLWRATTLVDSYVCIVPARRDALKRLLNQLRSYLREPKGRHASGMLVAGPGSGKTFLAKQLAKQLRLPWLSFNITEMLSREDLFEAFDTIASRQAHQPDETFLVFVDEINATLNSAPVYDAFLAPLEEGSYLRSGNRYLIQPCIWLFAGTALQGGNNPASKSSDFMSRLSLDLVDLSVQGHTYEEGLERVYLGASLLRHVFPDVREVSQKVLDAFFKLPDGFGPRQIRHFIERFQDIKYGKVTSQNVPIKRYTDIMQNDKHSLSVWKPSPEGDFVALE